MPKAMDQTNFLYPYTRFRGQFSPQNLMFNANLQEFAQRVDYLCAFHTNGKYTTEQAYAEIRYLWEQLEQNCNELGISSL
jgi:hypothetical protein